MVVRANILISIPFLVRKKKKKKEKEEEMAISGIWLGNLRIS